MNIELFKIKRKRYIGPDGKRCKKSDAGAIERIDVSDDWYADMPVIESTAQRLQRRSEGIPKPKRKRIKLCANKRAAKKMLERLIDAAERKAAGLSDFRLQTTVSVADLIDEYQKHLTAKGKSEKYIRLTMARLESVADGCQFLRVGELDSEKAAQWLYEQRQVSQAPRHSVTGFATSYPKIAEAFGVALHAVKHWKAKGAPIVARAKNDLSGIADWLQAYQSRSMGASTSNHYVTALRGFGKWLAVKRKIVETNPFRYLEKIDADADIRKQRRALSDSDFSKLIKTTQNSDKVLRELSGVDRAMIYTLAAYTGLRASEIGSLKSNSFDLSNEPPTVTVASGYTKNSDEAIQPLRADLAGQLESYLASRRPTTLSISQEPETVWPGTWPDVGAELIRKDLARAGIPYTDEHGNDYDFHALRHQFITGLARAGVSLTVAQELARHSKPDLTKNAYTHLSVRDTVGDVERLPEIPQVESERFQATGTDGAGCGKALGKAGFAKPDAKRHKQQSTAESSGHEKTPQSQGKTGFSEAPPVGLEPTTGGLTVRCSTN